MKHFLKGDRVVFRYCDGRTTAPGTVHADSDDQNGWTYIQYDNMPAGSILCSATERLEFSTSLKAETQSRAFCVETPADERKLMHLSTTSELDEELMQAGAFKCECNGHYGFAFFFHLNEEDVPNVGRYLQIIERHWNLA
jgi:hypothetical protein